MKSCPQRLRSWLRGSVFALTFVLLAGAAQGQIEDALSGTWKMEDESPALMHPSNPERFAIVRVVPGESQWADGSFFLRWPNEPRPERGYYSNKSGRVWFTTYRWVDGKRERVEYRGEISKDGDVSWTGMGTTTGGKTTTWSFVAKKSD